MGSDPRSRLRRTGLLIAVDTNILVYAHREDSPFHAAAVGSLAELAEGLAAWAIQWPCVHEFLAIVTHPRIYDPPTPTDRALDQVQAWLDSPTLVLLAESEQHRSELREQVLTSHANGGRIHDARIAALCRQHGVRELWSAERDFGRFPGLTVINPLFARLGDVAADRLPDQGFTYNLIFSYLADLAPNPRVAVLGTGGLRER